MREIFEIHKTTSFRASFLCLLILLSWKSQAASNDSVRFWGNAPQYSEQQIVFNRISDFIIPKISPAAIMNIDKDGNFDFSFAVNETEYLFAELGRFNAQIYVESGITYNLVFPPYVPKTESDKFNPHFEPEKIPFGIRNKEAQALNRNMIEFNEEFNYLYDKNAPSVIMAGNKTIVEEIILELEEHFNYSNPLFVQHKKLSYMKLRQLSQRMHERTFIEELSENEQSYNLPVFWEIFRTLLSGFLPKNFAGTSEISLSSAIDYAIRFDSIASILSSDILFSKRDFAETCLLFTLFESFYNKTLGETACLKIIESAIEYASTERNRTMAEMFLKQMLLLRHGSEAPNFAIHNQKDKIKKLDDYSGKFVYLNFMHTKRHACLLDLQTIDQLSKIFKKDLEIVTVFVDDDFEEIVSFLKKNNRYDWDFLHSGSQSQIIDDYSIKTVPTYFLIDPKGNLNMSPAPAPRENFNQIFVERFQEYRRSEMRNNPQKEKSIFD